MTTPLVGQVQVTLCGRHIYKRYSDTLGSNSIMKIVGNAFKTAYLAHL